MVESVSCCSSVAICNHWHNTYLNPEWRWQPRPQTQRRSKETGRQPTHRSTLVVGSRRPRRRQAAGRGYHLFRDPEAEAARGAPGIGVRRSSHLPWDDEARAVRGAVDSGCRRMVAASGRAASDTSSEGVGGSAGRIAGCSGCCSPC